MNYVDLKSSGNRDVKKQGRSKGRSILSYFPAFLFVAGVIFAALNAGKIKDSVDRMLNPVNIVRTITGSGSAKLKEDDGRTNILILGTDQRTTGDLSYSQLTDSIMLISVGRTARDAVVISIPRDLWVESSNGARYKINELYGTYGGQGAGTEEVVKAVSGVLGVPVHYYGVVNFALFKEVIDTLGGVEVNVETTFTDAFYPVEGKENAIPESDRYETISFSKGVILMNGETALKYARSRHGDNGEGTDFARARRQQNLIMAVKEKAMSGQTLLDFSKIKSLYDLYSTKVDSNLDISSLQVLYSLFQSKNFGTVRTLVLDNYSTGENGGLLYAPTDLTLYGGRYVLIPKAGDYSQIHAYIQKYLFN